MVAQAPVSTAWFVRVRNVVLHRGLACARLPQPVFLDSELKVATDGVELSVTPPPQDGIWQATVIRAFHATRTQCERSVCCRGEPTVRIVRDPR